MKILLYLPHGSPFFTIKLFTECECNMVIYVKITLAKISITIVISTTTTKKQNLICHEIYHQELGKISLYAQLTTQKKWKPGIHTITSF